MTAKHDEEGADFLTDIMKRTYLESETAKR